MGGRHLGSGKFRVIDWDVWHTFSSYLTYGDLNLSKVGERLVSSGVAEACLHRDGMAWWRNAEAVESGQVEYEFATGGRRAKVRMPQSVIEGEGLNYAREAIYQGAFFHCEERGLLRPDEDVPPSYVRAFLGPMRLACDMRSLTMFVYPMLKIFENGVILSEFRLIAPSQKKALPDFLDNFVNASLLALDSVAVPPAISRLAPVAYASAYFGTSIAGRIANYLKARRHAIAVSNLTQFEDHGDFKHAFAPLSSDVSSPETMSSIAQTLFSIVGYVIGGCDKENIATLFCRQRNIPVPGKRWFGRPSIFLMEFDGQQSSALKNEKKFGAAFGSLITRTRYDQDHLATDALPNDLRLSDDFSFFASSSAFLIVWAGKGIERTRLYADNNRGELVYGNQAII